MKKFLVMLTCILCLSFVLGMVPVSAAEPNDQKAYDLTGESARNDKQGLQINTAVASSGLVLQAATWGGTVKHYITVYPWAGTYLASIAGTPVAKATVPNGADNAWHRAEFKNPTTDAATTLPAGEYAFKITSDKGDVSYLIGTSNGKGDTQKVWGVDGFVKNYQANIKLTFTTTATTYFSKCSEPNWVNANGLPAGTLNGSTGRGAYIIESNSAVQFNAKSAFDGIKVNTATWSGRAKKMQFDLYKWDTNYATTVAGTPVYSKTHDYNGNTGDPAIELLFPALPAGEYVLVFSRVAGTGNDEGAVYVWWFEDTANDYQRIYEAGVARADYANRSVEMQLNFKSNPSTPFGALSDNQEDNKQTGDASVVAMAAVVGLCAVAVVVLRKRAYAK